MVYKNDDMGAFGGRIVVNFNNTSEYTITRAEFQCGSYYQNVENPVFPLEFKPTREDTKKFSNNNLCYLRVYDENGLRKTCKGTLNIPAQNEVIKHNDGLCC
jgi:hypothetical protein